METGNKKVAAVIFNLQQGGIFWDGHWLCRNLNLEATPGKVIWIRGANGSGKTTLLKALCGLRPFTAGTCRWQTAERSYLSHRLGVDNNLSVQQNLEFWTQIYRAQVTSDWQLDNLLAQPTYSLSAGQRQRLALACHTPSSAHVWLLDEPTSHLDGTYKKLFGTHLKRHLKNGGSAVIATHDVFLSWSKSDDVVLGV